MDEDSRTIKATCLCGNAKHEITLPFAKFPLNVFFCHCNSCRHQTGTLCLTLALMPKIYQPRKSLEEKLQAYEFSKRITTLFCPTCGTTLLLRILTNPEDNSSAVVYGIPTGTLEKAEGILKVLGHEHIQDTLDGGASDFITIVSGVPVARWPGHFEEHEQLPLYWSNPNRDIKPVATNDKLHGHCKCGDINFWIARPSDRSALVQASQPDLLIPHHLGTQPATAKESWWLRDNGNKFLAGLCSCDSCRLASGMEWVEWAFVPTIDISLDKDGMQPFTFDLAGLKCYRSSSEARRYFCGQCGAMIFWDGDDRQMLKDVAVGLLSAPEGARAESWLEWRTTRLSFREDSIQRAESLTLAVEAGLESYGTRLGGPVNPVT